MGGGTSTKKIKKQADYQYSLDQRAMQDQLNANRVNQTNPWGSVDWTQGPDGRWSETTTLNPQEQQRLDQQRGMMTGLGDVAQPLIGQVGKSLSGGVDFSGLGNFPTSPTNSQVGAGPQFGMVGAGPSFNTDFGSVDPNELAKMGQAGPAAGFGGASSDAERAREYELQKKLDMSGMPDMPEASEAARQQVIDAMYGQAMSRLQPQFETQRQQQLDRLYAMGGREGDPVFEGQKAALERSLTDANQQALWNAIGQGGAEQSRLFGLGLANRQQGWQEALGQGQFTNQALMNQFQQGLSNAQMGNQVGMANAANANQAGIASMNAANQMAQFNAGQGLQGLLSGLNFNRQGTQMGNEAQQQGWQNQLAGLGFNNQNLQQGFQNQMAGAGFNNQAGQQDYQNQLAARDAQIQEMLLQRGLPMQELGSVLGMMGQVQSPQFGGYAQGQIGAPDFLGSFMQAQGQKGAGLMSGLGMLAGIGGGMLGGRMGGAMAGAG
jgi:hypothetical protein